MGYSAYLEFGLFHKDAGLKKAVKSVGDQKEIGSISNKNLNLKPVLNASAPVMSNYLLYHACYARALRFKAGYYEV